jgi:hypothetical protein
VTDGNIQFIEVVVSMVVGTAVVTAVLYGDERRNRAPHARKRAEPNADRAPHARKRAEPNTDRAPYSPHAWLPATRDAAILGTFLFGWLYGCPALLIHFGKSRWSAAGWGIGLLWAVLLFAAVVGAALAAEAAIDWLSL